VWRKTRRTKLEQAEKYLHTAQDTTDWDGEKSQGIVGIYSKINTRDLPY
jgi:hypothetical protein